MVVLGTGGPGPKSSTGSLFEVSLLTRVFFEFLSVEIVMHHSCSLHFPIKTKHARTSREPFCLGAVKLNLLESTWSASCSVVTDHCGYMRASMDIEDLQCSIHSPVFSIYYKTNRGWGRRIEFNMKALRWLENGILKLVVVSAVFRESAILRLLFEAEFTESVV